MKKINEIYTTEKNEIFSINAELYFYMRTSFILL